MPTSCVTMAIVLWSAGGEQDALTQDWIGGVVECGPPEPASRPHAGVTVELRRDPTVTARAVLIGNHSQPWPETVSREGPTMIKIWSELPVMRAKEQVADLATLLWVVFWGNIVWQLFQFLADFAEAGRTVQAGGETMVQGGRDLGDSLAGLPLVGSQVRDVARDAFAGAGQPLSDFGTELEQFIFVVAIVLALLLALVTIAPWLFRYIPWRWDRVRNMRAAHRAIRTAPEVADASIELALAMRAMTRLDYSTLLEYTPDPLGDWTVGRHDRLARAELASVGLRS